MAQIKTIDTVAGENQIDFKRRYPFVWLKNLGDADVYISDKAGIVAEADGVVLLGAGQAAMLENYDDSVYVLGATTIEAHGQHSADSPFGDTIVAGGGGGGGGTIESLTVTQNGVYTASGGVDGYSPVSVEVPEPVLIEKTITQNGVYDPEDDNADGYSMIDVDVPAVEVIELNANMNRTYTAPAGKAYSPVNVSVPGTSISKLTVGHNNVTYEAGIGAAFDPVEVSIPMDTLNAPSNGVYEIDTTTQDGWDTVVVDTYEKFEVLYNRANRSPENLNGLVKPLTATDYDEFYMTAFYAYNDESAPTHSYASMWSTRYPIDAMMHKTNVGAFGSDNYMWTHANQYDPATEIRGFYSGNFSGYAFPFMYIGVKDRDAQRTTLYHDATAAIRTDITLSDNIFNYDELILTFSTGAYQSNNHTTTSAYPVSTIQIGKQLCGFNDYNGSYFRYEVTSATQLTLVHYQDFYLVDVQGIKNDSMEETVIFTNPSSSSVPATITLSETYKNFDEICLVGHTADAQFADMIITQYYPVKALTRELDIPVNKRIGLFLDVENCWLSIHGDTTLVPDSTSPAIILDKIIGINKPVLSVAHELIDVEPLSVTQNGTYTAISGKAFSPVSVDVSAPEYVDRNRGIVFYDDSGVSPVGFTKVDSITRSAFALSTSEQATVECCCNISLASTYGRIWQIGEHRSVGTTLAYNNNGAKPIFEIAISDTWDHNGTVDITEYLNTTITLSLVIKDTTSELYLNGTKIEEYSIGKSTLVSDTGYLCFLHGQMSDRTTNGNLYALRVYHRALTPAEIQQNVQADIYNFGSTTVISE